MIAAHEIPRIWHIVSTKTVRHNRIHFAIIVISFAWAHVYCQFDSTLGSIRIYVGLTLFLWFDNRARRYSHVEYLYEDVLNAPRSNPFILYSQFNKQKM